MAGNISSRKSNTPTWPPAARPVSVGLKLSVKSSFIPLYPTAKATLSAPPTPSEIFQKPRILRMIRTLSLQIIFFFLVNILSKKEQFLHCLWLPGHENTKSVMRLFPCPTLSCDWISMRLLFRWLAISQLLMIFVAVIEMVRLISVWFIKGLAILFEWIKTENVFSMPGSFSIQNLSMCLENLKFI